MSTPDTQLDAFDPFESEDALRAPLLMALVQEALIVCSLAVCGLVARVTVLTIAPEVWGPARSAVYVFSELTTWLLIGAYVCIRLGLVLRDQLRSLSALARRDLKSEPAGESATKRLGAARAQRRADGLPASILVREEFFPRLATELGTLTAKASFSMVLAHVEAASAGHDNRAVVLAAAAREIQAIVRTEDLVAHLGDGLFAIGFPGTDAESGRRPRELLRMSLFALVEHHGGSLTDSFVAATGGESAQMLYRRAVATLAPVDRMVLRHAS